MKSVKIFSMVLVLSLFLLGLCCGGKDQSPLSTPTDMQGEKKEETKKQPEDVPKKMALTPINFKNIRGVWRLKYANNYGYEFRLHSNYRAIVIIFLKDSSLVFRGIYTIADDGTLRITLSEMKRVTGVKHINVSSRFVKTKSSYFYFFAGHGKKKKAGVLIIRPKKIFIDGNNSEGYFEPLISLKKIR